MLDLNRIEDFELRLCIETVLAKERVVAELEDKVLSHADPSLRSHVVHVCKSLERDNRRPFDIVADLDALAERISPLIEEGSRREWVGDEYDVNGGHLTFVRDSRASDFVRAITAITNLRETLQDLRVFLKGVDLMGQPLRR